MSGAGSIRSDLVHRMSFSTMEASLQTDVLFGDHVLKADSK